MSHTIGDLKKALASMPDDMPLIYAKDDEGNGYQCWMASKYKID
jgi:hypothetical protein